MIHLGKKTWDCDAARAKAGEIEKGLEVLCNAHKTKERETEGLESQVASDSKAIAHLVKLVKDYFSNFLRITSENG